jgi:MscS family membrane protein
VRFASFGESSLNVEVWSWIATRAFVEYTGIVEELNFSIAEIVQRAGTSFAFPSRTIYMARDGVVDATRAKEIAQEMAQQRPGGPAAGEASDEPGQGRR